MDIITDIFEFAAKSPQISELNKQCYEIKKGNRKSISKKVIDDAFDAFKVIVKNFSNDPDEILELCKKISEHYMCNIINSYGARIEE